jgi:hypothetical protein
MKKQLMTPGNPRWEEFIGRLEGPEGCNFQAEYDEGEVIVDTVTWACGGGEDKSKAAAILNTMPEIDVAASLNFFEQHGGFCDCEIVFNVEERYRSGQIDSNGSLRVTTNVTVVQSQPISSKMAQKQHFLASFVAVEGHCQVI